MSKNLFILLLSSIVISACGGGGGGSGGSGASPISYSYDKTTAEFATSKTWQADSITRRLRKSSNEWTWDWFATYGHDPEGPLDIQFVEGADYIEINLGHKLATYNINLSEIDSSINPLYDPSGNIVAAIAQNNYTDATLRSFFFFPEYLATLNIEHTNIGFLDLFSGGLNRDTFALNYGSKTYPGDMPSSGTASFGIFGEGIYTEYPTFDTGYAYVIRGDGSLTANFGSNRISGSLTFDSFYGYFDFLANGATSESQIMNAPVFTINFPETSISGNSFEYNFNNPINISSSSGWGISGDGIAGGSFFGPDGKEVSGTFLLTKDDYDQSELFEWDLVGAFYGTCKPNC